jgi:hypothetical protein
MWAKLSLNTIASDTQLKILSFLGIAGDAEIVVCVRPHAGGSQRCAATGGRFG